jgi:hypothetical protein
MLYDEYISSTAWRANPARLAESLKMNSNVERVAFDEGAGTDYRIANDVA